MFDIKEALLSDCNAAVADYNQKLFDSTSMTGARCKGDTYVITKSIAYLYIGQKLQSITYIHDNLMYEICLTDVDFNWLNQITGNNPAIEKLLDYESIEVPTAESRKAD